MRHEEAWTRLPDLLADRDDAALLAHVGACANCQRQLFLLGRVDRLLRERASARRARRTGRPSRRRVLAAAAAVAAAAATAVPAVFLAQRSGTHELELRTVSGQSVGGAVVSRSDARNASLALTARGLPVDRGQMFVLWAGDTAGTPMQVGRFMVDRNGGCRVRFNLPGTHDWGRFWITRPGRPATIVAST